MGFTTSGYTKLTSHNTIALSGPEKEVSLLEFIERAYRYLTFQGGKPKTKKHRYKRQKKSRRYRHRKHRSRKNKAGVLTFTHLREFKKLKSKANNLPTGNYDSPSDIPNFLRDTDIQNNPDNWAKDNLWRCLNKCRKKPGIPECEAKCIQNKIDKTERQIYFQTLS